MRSQAIEHYDRLLADRHAASTAELIQGACHRHDMFYADGRPWIDVLRPYVIERAAYDKIRHAAARVDRAVQMVTRRMLDDREFRRRIGFPRHLEPFLAIDGARGNWTLMARLDGFVTGSSVAFIEYNTEPGGMASSSEVERLFSSLPVADEFRRRFPFRCVDNTEQALAAIYTDTCSQRAATSGPPVIAVLKVSASLTQSRLLRWLPYAAHRGCRVFAVDPEQIDCAGDRVVVEGHAVDLLVVVDWTKLFPPTRALQRVLQAVGAGKVRTLNGIAQCLAGGAKVVFEALSNPEHANMFDRETAATLRESVPWTRWVRDCTTDYRGAAVDLIPFIAEHRVRFALKPSGGQGGRGLVIGSRCDDATWQTAIASAGRHPHVVQEWLDVAREPYPALDASGALVERELVSDANPFVWNGARVDGMLVRASEQTNLSAGTGAVLPVWILD